MADLPDIRDLRQPKSLMCEATVQTEESKAYRLRNNDTDFMCHCTAKYKIGEVYYCRRHAAGVALDLLVRTAQARDLHENA